MPAGAPVHGHITGGPGKPARRGDIRPGVVLGGLLVCERCVGSRCVCWRRLDRRPLVELAEYVCPCGGGIGGLRVGDRFIYRGRFLPRFFPGKLIVPTGRVFIGRDITFWERLSSSAARCDERGPRVVILLGSRVQLDDVRRRLLVRGFRGRLRRRELQEVRIRGVVRGRLPVIALVRVVHNVIGWHRVAAVERMRIHRGCERRFDGLFDLLGIGRGRGVALWFEQVRDRRDVRRVVLVVLVLVERCRCRGGFELDGLGRRFGFGGERCRLRFRLVRRRFRLLGDERRRGSGFWFDGLGSGFDLCCEWLRVRFRLDRGRLVGDGRRSGNALELDGPGGRFVPGRERCRVRVELRGVRFGLFGGRRRGKTGRLFRLLGRIRRQCLAFGLGRRRLNGCRARQRGLGGGRRRPLFDAGFAVPLRPWFRLDRRCGSDRRFPVRRFGRGALVGPGSAERRVHPAGDERGIVAGAGSWFGDMVDRHPVAVSRIGLRQGRGFRLVLGLAVEKPGEEAAPLAPRVRVLRVSFERRHASEFVPRRAFGLIARHVGHLDPITERRGTDVALIFAGRGGIAAGSGSSVLGGGLGGLARGLLLPVLQFPIERLEKLGRDLAGSVLVCAVAGIHVAAGPVSHRVDDTAFVHATREDLLPA